MSLKGKSLSYEAHEPSFLRKLRDQQAGCDRDRHERPIPRPRKAKVDDQDDEPTYVLEDGNGTLSKAEYEALISGSKANDESQVRAPTPVKGENLLEKPVENVERDGASDADALRKKQEVTEVGASLRKRKAAKVISIDDRQGSLSTSSPNSKRPKKKAKNVKLAFDAE